MKLKKRNEGLVMALALAAILTVFSGCQKTEPPPEPPVVDVDETVNVPEETPDETENTDQGTEVLPDDTEETVEDPLPKFYNALTGLECTEELSTVRPVAIMINNLRAALPQQGISHADIVYEVLAEGGITRLLCLFTDYTSLPETGSVRSSRDYYIDLADAHDAIYVHCGTSPQAKETLAARGTDNMDGIYFSTPFYRNKERQKNMGQEHSMMTDGERLVKGIEEKGYRTTSDAKQPFCFGEDNAPVVNAEADSVKLKYSYYVTAEFAYDDKTKTYFKSQFGEPHIDANNDKQLEFTNVILLYANQYQVPGDTEGRLAVEFVGEGEGVYITHGGAKDITWKRDSRTSSYTLYDAYNGKELIINPGKTYVGIPPIGAELTLSGDTAVTE